MMNGESCLPLAVLPPSVPGKMYSNSFFPISRSSWILSGNSVTSKWSITGMPAMASSMFQ